MSESLSAICKCPFFDSKHPASHATLVVLAVALIIIASLAAAGVMNSCMGTSNASILCYAGFAGGVLLGVLEIYNLFRANQGASLDKHIEKNDSRYMGDRYVEDVQPLSTIRLLSQVKIQLHEKLTRDERLQFKKRVLEIQPQEVGYKDRTLLDASAKALLKAPNPKEYISRTWSVDSQDSPQSRTSLMFAECLLEIKAESELLVKELDEEEMGLLLGMLEQKAATFAERGIKLTLDMVKVKADVLQRMSPARLINMDSERFIDEQVLHSLFREYILEIRQNKPDEDTVLLADALTKEELLELRQELSFRMPDYAENECNRLSLVTPAAYVNGFSQFNKASMGYKIVSIVKECILNMRKGAPLLNKPLDQGEIQKILSLLDGLDANERSSSGKGLEASQMEHLKEQVKTLDGVEPARFISRLRNEGDPREATLIRKCIVIVRTKA